MVTITKNKIRIEFEHPCPDEVVKDFREAIILTLQHVDYDNAEVKRLQRSNYFMLELLKHLDSNS